MARQPMMSQEEYDERLAEARADLNRQLLGRPPSLGECGMAKDIPKMSATETIEYLEQEQLLEPADLMRELTGLVRRASLFVNALALLVRSDGGDASKALTWLADASLTLNPSGEALSRGKRVKASDLTNHP